MSGEDYYDDVDLGVRTPRFAPRDHTRGLIEGMVSVVELRIPPGPGVPPSLGRVDLRNWLTNLAQPPKAAP